MDKDSSTIEAQLNALTERVSRLEEAASRDKRPLTDIPPGEVDFQLMERLQSRKGDMFDAENIGGSVVYAGDFRNKDGKGIWYVERAVPFLANYDTETLAQMLASLGNPQRLMLVKALLRGAMDRQQIQTALGISSAGQLYHHLNSLLSAGVIIQQRRGVYAIKPTANVPLLVILAATVDITEKQDALDSEASDA